MEPALIVTARKVVEEWQYQHIDNKTGTIVAEPKGVILDGFTASMVVQVYDKVNQGNKEMFPKLVARLGCVALIDKLWKVAVKK